MDYRYSQWNPAGSGAVPDADEVLARFGDELLAGADPSKLMQQALREGMQTSAGESMPGLRDLLAEIEAARERELARYDLDTILDDVRTELQAMAETGDIPPSDAPPGTSASESLMQSPQNQQPQPPPGGPAAPDEKDRNDNPGMGCDCCGTGGGGCCDGGGGQGGAPSPHPRLGDRELQDGDDRASGVLVRGGSEASTNGRSPRKGDVRRLLSRLTSRHRSYLGGLPSGPQAQFASFSGYELLTPEAMEKVQEIRFELAHLLKQHYFPRGDDAKPVDQALDRPSEGMDPAASQSSGNDGREDGGTWQDGAPALDSSENGAADTPIAQLQALLQSLSPEVRREAEQLIRAALEGELSPVEAARLEATVDAARSDAPARGYRFSGSESIGLGEAMELIERLAELDRLTTRLRKATPKRLDEIDAEAVARLLGDEAAASLDALQRLCRAVQEAGYMAWQAERLTLTARGLRRLGDRAAHDIFARLDRAALGRHNAGIAGPGLDRMDDRKLYEFGDPFLLEAQETIRHAVVERGAGCPVRLRTDDFIVSRSQTATRAATVLMVDLSRSMLVRGCFVAARRVVLALSSLIRERFPLDTLYVLGFSDRARELPLDTLPEITWDDHATNMQDGFQLARRLLARDGSENRQIVLVTDGEPTAHLAGDRIEFAYPPSEQTLKATLLEVRRCTRERIVINTFMLERGRYLTEFVDQMARINRGRAFFTPPEALGSYVLADYVCSRRGWAS